MSTAAKPLRAGPLRAKPLRAFLLLLLFPALAWAGYYGGGLKDHGHTAPGDGGILTTLTASTRFRVGASTMDATHVETSTITSTARFQLTGDASSYIKNFGGSSLYPHNWTISATTEVATQHFPLTILSSGTGFTQVRIYNSGTGGSADARLDIGNQTPDAVTAGSGGNGFLVTYSGGSVGYGFGSEHHGLGGTFNREDYWRLKTGSLGEDQPGTYLISASSSGVTTLGLKDRAPATGYVGEILSSGSFSNGSHVTSGNYENIVQLQLTPGTWDLMAQTCVLINSATITRFLGVVSNFSGTTTTDHSLADNLMEGDVVGLGTTANSCVSIFLTTTTTLSPTYYLKEDTIYSAGTPLRVGKLVARRR